MRNRLLAVSRSWRIFRTEGGPRPLLALGILPEGESWVDPATKQPLDPQPGADEVPPAHDPYEPLEGEIV